MTERMSVGLKELLACQRTAADDLSRAQKSLQRANACFQRPSPQEVFELRLSQVEAELQPLVESELVG